MREELRNNVLLLSGEIASTCSKVIETLKESMANADHPAHRDTLANDIKNVQLVVEALHSVRNDAASNRLTKSSVLLIKLTNEHAREKLIRVLFRIDQQKTLREGIYKKLDEIESPLGSLVG